MEATLLTSGFALPFKRVPKSRVPHYNLVQNHPANESHHRKNGLMIIKKKLVVSAKQLGHENEGESSEENSIILNLRIKKLEKMDSISNQDGENKLFTQSQDDFCEKIMEFLQSYLINNRPNLALGILALAAISVPLSSSGVMDIALKVAKGLLSGCHIHIDIDF